MLRLVFKSIVVVFGALLLSSCAGLHQMMSNVSNKNGGSIPAKTETAQTTPAQKCQSWCHNGWCSTHCENAADVD